MTAEVIKLERPSIDGAADVADSSVDRVQRRRSVRSAWLERISQSENSRNTPEARSPELLFGNAILEPDELDLDGAQRIFDSLCGL